MKSTLLLQLVTMSRYLLFGLVLQTMFSCMLIASDLHAQWQRKSIEDIYLSIEADNLRVTDIFHTISEETGFSFAYNEQLINLRQRISLQARNASLADILREISKTAALKFKRVNEYIHVGKLEKDEKNTVEEKIVSLRINVTGKVTSEEDEEGLPGVNVLVKGTSTGTVTDIDGNYKIEVPDAESVLVFSSIGFMTEELVVGNQTVINVGLLPDIKALDEIVVVGYGTMKKSDLTGSVGSVRSDQLEQDINVTADQALQGKIAGVNVFTGSHEPGGVISVEVRGTASMNAGGSPLYVIDGIPLSESQGTNTNISTDGTGYNPMSSIDPSNIESIEVLKGASATAIYGSRGSNGVVIITTKKGAIGKPQINYSGNIGFATNINKLDLLNASEHAELWNEQARIEGVSEYFTSEEVKAFGKGTDWQDELFRTAVLQKHNLSFSGGNKMLQYFIGGSYVNDEGIILGSNFRRIGTVANLSAQISDRFKIDQNFQFTTSNQAKILNGSKGYQVADLMSTLVVATPMMPVYDENGDYADPSQYKMGYSIENPMKIAKEYKMHRFDNRVLGSITGTYTLMDGLDFSVRLGADLLEYKEATYLPIGASYAPDGSGRLSQSTKKNFLNENLFSYNKSFDKHAINAVAGFTYQNETFTNVLVGGKGFSSNYPLYWNLGSATFPSPGTTYKSEWTLLSGIGRVNYTYNDKYLFTATIRADGSSKFGANNKWGYFPSAAFAWRISSENFMQNVSSLSDMKLRLSWGQSGNDRISPYSSLALMNYGLTVIGTNDPGVTTVTATPGNMANDDLGWEKSEDYGIGLDIGLFDDKFNFTLDLYKQTTTDLVLGIPIPQQSGYGSITSNTGSMENKGIEFAMQSVNISTKNFRWTSSVTLAHNENKILDLGGNDFVYTGWLGGGNISSGHGATVVRLEVGKPVGLFYGYRMHPDRVWQSEEEIQEVGTRLSAKPGDYRFMDIKGGGPNGDEPDGTWDGEDEDYIGDPNPDIIYGITNDFKYKRWNLRVFIQGTYGNDILMVNKRYISGGTEIWRPDRENRWTPENPIKGPGVNMSARGHYPKELSDDRIYDGSFLRFKTIRLGYNIPIKVFRTAQVFAVGENLFTITSYPGYDPEVNALGASNSVKGIDAFGYPSSKVIRLGINLGF